MVAGLSGRDWPTRHEYQKELRKCEEFAVELIELWRVIRKHLAMIVVVTVVAAATAGILSKFVLPKQYASTATLMVIPQNSAQDLLTNLVTG